MRTENLVAQADVDDDNGDNASDDGSLPSVNELLSSATHKSSSIDTDLSPERTPTQLHGGTRNGNIPTASGASSSNSNAGQEHGTGADSRIPVSISSLEVADSDAENDDSRNDIDVDKCPSSAGRLGSPPPHGHSVPELRERRLESIIGRALCLGTTRLKELQKWRDQDGVDFASSVEHVMSATDSTLQPDSSVTVDQIDETLDRIAVRSSFSSPKLRANVQARQAAPTDTQSELSKIFRRLRGLEAKWLVRMLLKSYSPVHVPEKIAMHRFHFLLPDLLGIQDSFEAAMELLRQPTIARIPVRVAEDTERLLRELAIGHVRPQIGTMVMRPEHDKARSIKHCSQLADSRRMSVERKYNGEYCQVHIDLSRAMGRIQIFSKSGKDSTSDREGLHPAIRESLRLGTADCVIKQQCILEGELLVWNDGRHRLEPFHKIRKHVKRSGRFLGTLQDSPTDPDEHLMIMLYDILLLDDIACIKENLEQRRQRLCSLAQCIRGRVGIGSRKIIDFSSGRATILLQEVFTQAITRRWEGLVLKGCDDPYFSLDGTRFIKLKKDYIAGLGDAVDLAIVGGRRDATDEQEMNIGRLRWTSFYIGCLENKDEVRRSNAKPHFRILATVGRYNISKTDMRYINERGNFVQVPFALSTPGLSVTIDQKDLSQPTELFKRPFVVEVMGAGFDKPANVSHFTLRFPRVQKVHLDRTIEDTVSFGELQEMARATYVTPQDDDEDGNISWVGTPHSLEHASPSLSNRSTSTDSSQSSTDTTTASDTLSLDARMRAEGLVMIDETKTISAKLGQQRGEWDGNMDSKGLISPSSEESVSRLSTKRKREADTILPRHGCRKRTRKSTVHAEDDQHKRRQSIPTVKSWTSDTSECNELVAAESQSQNMISNFMPPLFLSASLFHLFSHPTQPLCKILHRLQILVLSTDSVIDCGSTRSGLKSMVGGTKPLIRVIYVDAAQVEAVARELESTVKAMMQYHASGQLLIGHRVLFFDWNVLKGQERLEDVSELEWRRAFVGGVLGGCDQIQTHLGEILD